MDPGPQVSPFSANLVDTLQLQIKLTLVKPVAINQGSTVMKRSNTICQVTLSLSCCLMINAGWILGARIIDILLACSVLPVSTCFSALRGCSELT